MLSSDSTQRHQTNYLSGYCVNASKAWMHSVLTTGEGSRVLKLPPVHHLAPVIPGISLDMSECILVIVWEVYTVYKFHDNDPFIPHCRSQKLLYL